MSSTLATVVAQTVTFLIQPLTGWYNLPTLNKLKHALTHSLTAQFTTSWQEAQPAVLNLAPGMAPSRSIYNACQLVGDVDWVQWMQAIEAWHCASVITLLAKPNSLAMRLGTGQYSTIWHTTEAKRSAQPPRTLAMQVLESDDGQEIFAELQNQTLHDGESTPNWLNHTLNSFPRVPTFPTRSGSPTDSLASHHSRSSSFSSASSRTSFSSFSSESVSSIGSVSPVCTRSSVPLYDDSKKEVTAYDGGKTTVLTGGVMLGGHAAHKTSPTSPSRTLPTRAPSSWRSSRC